MEDILKLGLVTHANSSYLNNQGKHNLFSELLSQLEVSTFYISDFDKTSPSLERIDLSEELQSLLIYFISLIQTQLNLVYFTKLKNITGVLMKLLTSFHIILLLSLNLILSKFFKRFNLKYRSIMSRQHNISESHIVQFIDSLTVASQYSLILEDDFRINQSFIAKSTIETLVKFMDSHNEASIISVSESFSFRELGISKAVKHLSFNNISLYKPVIPITNTVSAMLYKSKFLSEILSYLIQYRKYRIIPIDHKMNMALYQLYKKKDFNSDFFYLMSPGLFIQDSIHGQ